MLAVFFSRERLPWEDDPDWTDDLKNAQHLLGGFAESDADKLLRAIPINDENTRRAIIEGAREESHRTAAIYPLLLDLQVDHWQELTARGEATADRFCIVEPTFEGRRREIVSRMLRDYGAPMQTTMERLSVARRFDRSAFQCVVEHFGTKLPFDNFERIARLSFVTRHPDGFLTVHEAVARTIRDCISPDVRQSSVDALFKHFTERAGSKSETLAGSPRC